MLSGLDDSVSFPYLLIFLLRPYDNRFLFFNQVIFFFTFFLNSFILEKINDGKRF